MIIKYKTLCRDQWTCKGWKTYYFYESWRVLHIRSILGFESTTI